MADQTPIQELIDIVNRYKGQWKLGDHVNSLKSKLGERVMAETIWDGVRAGTLAAGNSQALWRALVAFPDLYDASDFGALVSAIHAVVPDGKLHTQGGYSHIWSEESIEGRVYELHKMLESKREDETFIQAICAAYPTFPDAYENGIASSLVEIGALPIGALPASFLEESARRWTKNDSSSSRSLGGEIWPAEQWGAALVAACIAPGAGVLNCTIVAEVAPYASLSQMITLAGNSRADTESLQAVEALDSVGNDDPEATAAAWEAAALTLNITEGPQYHQGWPALMVVAATLRACTRAGREPIADLDGVLTAFITHYKSPFGGGYYDRYHDALRSAFSGLSLERRERLVLAADDNFSWDLCVIASTPAVAERVVLRLQGMGKMSSYEQGQFDQNMVHGGMNGRGVLRNFGPGVLPAFTRAVIGAKFPQRHILIAGLATSGDPIAVPGLTSALNDSSKPVRATARDGLSTMPAAVVVPALQSALSAGKKTTRLAAAEVLVALEPSVAGGAAAQARLAKEKVGDIRTLLERVPTPDADSSAGDEDAEIEASLTDSDGETWEQHIGVGPKLVPIYLRFLERKYHGKTLSGWEKPAKHWLALLAHFWSSDDTAAAALSAVPAYGYSASQYLSDLQDLQADIRVGLARILASGNYRRSPGFGKGRAFELKNALAWVVQEDTPGLQEAILPLLGDKRKGIRGLVRAYLERTGTDSLLQPLAKMLTESTELGRIQAAELLVGIGSAAALEAIQAAAAVSQKPGAKRALEIAETELRGAQLDVASTPDDTELDKALAALPALPLPAGLETSKLPTLRWNTGAELSRNAHEWILGAVLAESEERRNPQLPILRERLNKASYHALSEALHQLTARVRTGWPLYQLATIGSPTQLVALGGILDDLASSQSTNWGSDGVEVLLRHGSDLAIRLLDHASRKSRKGALKRRANCALHRMAKERDLSVDDLIDSAMSDYGFDRKGERILRYGSRDFRLKLGRDNTVDLNEIGGKAYKNLPKPLSSDDLEACKAAKREFSELKKQLKSITRIQLQRLELAMAGARQWVSDDWRSRFVEHPILQGLARNLIWEVADDASPRRFTVDPSGDYQDVNYDPVEIPEGGSVRLAHPATMSEAEIAAWQQVFVDSELIAPFRQLEREVYALETLPTDDATLFRSLPNPSGGRLMGGLTKLGYERGPREDAGLINFSTRCFQEYVLTLSHDGYSPEDPTWGDIDFQGISVSKSGESVAWRELPTALLSEVVRDLHILAGPPS